jgi:hypothetical protein
MDAASLKKRLIKCLLFAGGKGLMDQGFFLGLRRNTAGVA